MSHFVITENEDKRPLIERDSLNAIEWRKVRAYFLKERDDRKARDAQLRGNLLFLKKRFLKGGEYSQFDLEAVNGALLLVESAGFEGGENVER